MLNRRGDFNPVLVIRLTDARIDTINDPVPIPQFVGYPPSKCRFVLDVAGYNIIHHQLLEGILDHSKDKQAIEKKDKYFVSKRGRRSMRKITVGW